MQSEPSELNQSSYIMSTFFIACSYTLTGCVIDSVKYIQQIKGTSAHVYAVYSLQHKKAKQKISSIISTVYLLTL